MRWKAPTQTVFISIVLAVALVGPAKGMFVDVQFIGGVDIAAFESWNWGEGSPMANQEVERAVRATVEQLMATKGYAKTDGDVDCYITLHTKADEWFDGGLFKIEAVDGSTGKVVWRGKAEGAVNVQSTAKRQKLARRYVKKMFKKFPKKRIE